MAMSVNGVSNNYTKSVSSYDYQKTQTEKAKETTTETTSTTSNPATSKVDSFEKSTTYKPDREKINSMKAEMSSNVSAFRQMVQGLFQTQGGKANTALNTLLNIDKVTQADAQKAISEDGEWGVNKTAERILNFAKALSGGDPEKAEMLREAVKKGFSAAEKVWGGKLPDISQQTYNKVMEGFDEWAASGKKSE